MGLLTLTSTNPKFSYIIRKNPSTGMIKRCAREGEMSGYYYRGSSDKYVVYMTDFAENSFKENGENNYLNPMIYASSIFVIHAINHFFLSAFKEECEDDASGFSNNLTVNIVSVNGRAFKIISRILTHYTHFNVSLKPVSKTIDLYEISINTNQSLYHLMNFAFVFFTMLISFENTDFFRDDPYVTKLVGCINKIDTPFYVRYLIGSQILTKNQFMYCKSELEKISGNTCTLAMGTTAQQRQRYIASILRFNKPIIDIGCGEGDYAIPFSAKISDNQYHAIDTDVDELEKLQKKIDTKEIKNITLYNNFGEFLTTYSGEKMDVIVTEVIEHMGIESARSLLLHALNLNFDKMIITTPNVEFNKHYMLEGKFRHDDHKYEMTRIEFEEFMTSIMNDIDTDKVKYTYKYISIGDVVDGVSTTQGYVVEKLV
jgi:hypothetical protein